MNRDDIIRMAESCGIPEFENNESQADNIMRFANLVAAAERNRTWTQDHWTEYERSIAAAEREACIDIVAIHGGSVEIESAIRAREKA